MKKRFFLSRLPFFIAPVLLITLTLPHESSSSGTGLFETLRGYAGELGNVLKEVTFGVQKLGKQIKNFEDFLDATIDEDCYFECPPGQKIKAKPGHKPISNGCGSYGLEVINFFLF